MLTKEAHSRVNHVETGKILDTCSRLQIQLGADPEDVLQRLTVKDLRRLVIFHALFVHRDKQAMVDILLDRIYALPTIAQRVRQATKQLFR
jgi:hypothetical protein